MAEAGHLRNRAGKTTPISTKSKSTTDPTSSTDTFDETIAENLACKNGAYKYTRQLLKKKEEHNNNWNTEPERRTIVNGYLIIMGCNMLSCWSLYMYMTSQITASKELQYEFAFLVFKGVCEMYQGKFSWALLLHHTAMMLGFWFNAQPYLQCFSWIVVHQQYVHLPFAIRALWRLTLPSLGYIASEVSWTRRFISNVFWMAWMFVVGYRTPLITFYGLWAAYTVNDQNNKPMVWQGLVTFGFGCVIMNLDRLWTKAMWPKKPKATMLHSFYFHTGTRFMFVFGIFTALIIMFSNDLQLKIPTTNYLITPSWASFRLTGLENQTTLECLVNNNFTLDSRPDKMNRFKEFIGL
jgi:hypothetical protein